MPGNAEQVCRSVQDGDALGAFASGVRIKDKGCAHKGKLTTISV
jgi:hypothetical protein